MLALLLATGAALAGVSRFTVVVGNNEGHQETEPLVFAEEDAAKIHGLLTELGGIAPEHARLIRGGTRSQVLHALVDVNDAVATAKARGDQTVVVFYYSGHADDRELHLGRHWLRYDELEQLLAKSGADVRIALLDACQSGAMTREKGATRAPSFVFDLGERIDAHGQVIITSSAADEASQESDEIGGSYFTHFLASALTGAADDDGDRIVTLSEAYRYVYRETVYRTSSSRRTQHPTFSWELQGRGDVVLADLNDGAAPLVFPASMVGRYALFDQGLRRFLAEVEVTGDGPREVFLPPGSYLVQQRYPTHLEVAEVDLDGRTPVMLGGAAFASMEYEDDAAKGAIDRTIRRARRPDLSLSAGIGARKFTADQVSEGYFPAAGMVAFQARWTWRSGPWLSADALQISAENELQIEDLTYGIPVALSGSSIGVTGGIATPARRAQAGLGVRLATTYIRRSFPGQDVPDQDLFTVAPGVVGWLGVHAEPYTIDLELRSHYLPYRLDGADLGLGFTEAVFSVGYRF